MKYKTQARIYPHIYLFGIFHIGNLHIRSKRGIKKSSGNLGDIVLHGHLKGVGHPWNDRGDLRICLKI